MKHIIIWSGGLDSTWLLYKYAVNSSIENPITAISIEGKFLDKRKIIMERKAKKKILEILKKKGCHINHIIIKSNVKSDIYLDYFNTQPVLWLCNIIPIIPLEECTVHFGYIKEDSFWHCKDIFVKSFYNLTDLRLVGSRKDIKLQFDLEWFTKKEIIRLMKINGLYKHTWSCEFPTETFKRCGKCYPCKTIKLNDVKIKHKNRERKK